jgi:hypothetical protein
MRKNLAVITSTAIVIDRTAELHQMNKLATLLSTCLLAASQVAHTQEVPKKEAARAASPRAVIAHPIMQKAASLGVVDCLGKINQVSNFLAAGNQSSALLFLNKTEPAQHLISASLEIHSNNTLGYASASFSAGPGNSCEALYETVVYWQEDCAVVSKRFPTMPASAPLLKHITPLVGGEQVRVFLMPAGKGCVSIKKEVLF